MISTHNYLISLIIGLSLLILSAVLSYLGRLIFGDIGLLLGAAFFVVEVMLLIRNPWMYWKKLEGNP